LSLTLHNTHTVTLSKKVPVSESDNRLISSPNKYSG